MTDYKYVLFDLDGTLSDSGPGIRKAVQYALAKYGMTENDEKKLNRFVGPPLYDSFETFYGFSKEKAVEAVRFFREYYVDIGLFENTPYDGIEKALCDLKKAGKRLIVATSKPEKLAVKILNHFGLAKYFDEIAGATDDGSIVKKADVINVALSRQNIVDTSTCVMVGDRSSDIVGARAVGMDGMGVLYGYGSLAEMNEVNPKFIAEKVEDIANILV